MRRWLVAALLAAPLAFAVECACDASARDTLAQRQCSLCNEAEKQPADIEFFYLKDNNPRKPNRWLVLPRRHWEGAHHLHDFPAKSRSKLWAAAIVKARELWGDEWGLAYNGEKVRTQCHLHIHIGKLLKGVERETGFIVVDNPSQIPAPNGGGIWVHPVGRKLHVHLHEQTTETVLLR